MPPALSFIISFPSGRDVAVVLVAFWFHASPLSSCASPQLYNTGGARGGIPPQITQTGSVLPANPASMARDPGASVSVWVTQLYELPELRPVGLSSSISSPRFGIGLQVRSLRFDRYAEEQFDLHLGWSPWLLARGNTRFGAGFLLARNTNARYSSDVNFGWKLGILHAFNPSLTIGSVLVRSFSPRRDGSRSGYDKVGLGVSFHASKASAIYADVWLERFFPASYRVGLESIPNDVLSLRGGVATDPDRIVVGFSISIAGVGTHFAFERHLQLGWSLASELVIEL